MPRNLARILLRLAPRALAVMACAVSGATSLQAQFTIENLELHIPGGTRGSVTQLIPLRSEIDQVQQVRIWMGDWTRDSLGGNQILEYATTEHSCGGRVSVFPSNLQLGPRATEYVRVTYDAPANPDDGCWAIVLSETVRPPSQVEAERSASITISTIVGVKIYVHAANAVANAEVVSADVEEFWLPLDPPSTDSTIARQLAVRLANTGTAHLIVKSQVELRDERGNLVHRLTGDDAYVTPDAFRDILVRLPALPRGRYAAIVLLDFGADEISAAQVEFEIP
ncbi:MAG TPA: hypothetical protein PK788_02340 [Gemmatimonadaceae bacterium]|nr:hypothetical protein [Gemmatimonadaceae bacterium]HRQ78082.1 hypothetical protein [Gemmatimonadaceae bacterium]